ncbi:hypothetical protein [Halostreptopolyspora alba]|uniref:Uncharacterized protein n=1 Tax=Halostreptopolyspora alba TaxID=2487137 RepID=A0A3N0EB24_9ACTN|nr:hypothetical protein EFW17_09905 [Nocardiopsaceae bacterium YIM 96095]
MSEDEEKEKKRRLDLSMSQVAGGGLATLTAAAAASYLGVYGTIIGAAVMSVLSTAGTAMFQHFFQQSGDRAKGIAERARTPPDGGDRAGSGANHESYQHGPGDAAAPTEAPEAVTPHSRSAPGDTSATRAFSPSESQDETAVLGRGEGGSGRNSVSSSAGAAPATPTTPTGEPPGTGGSSGDGDEPAEGGRSWWRGWWALLLPALAVFALAMLLILAFELFTGRSLHDTVHGGDTRSAPTILGGYPTEQQDDPTDGPSPDTGNTENRDGEVPDPDASEPDGRTGQPDEEPGTGGDTDESPRTDPGTDREDGQQDAPESRDGDNERDDTDDSGGGAAPPGGDLQDQP